MNILFEIADRDLLFIGFASLILITVGAIIFYVLDKKNRIDYGTEEISNKKEENSSEMFENIKPETKEQQEAKHELEKVFKQMSEDLEKKEENIVDDFEKEQEENAIISYQELIKQAETKRNNPNGIEDEKENKNNLTINDNEEPKKFRNSDIISPIFGIQSPDEYKEQKKKKEQQEVYEDLAVAYEKDNIEFLNSLKNFRNNL